MGYHGHGNYHGHANYHGHEMHFSLSVNLSLVTRIRVRGPTAAAMWLKLDDAALSRSNKIDFVSLLQPRQGGAGKLAGGR